MSHAARPMHLHLNGKRALVTGAILAIDGARS